MNQPLPEVDLAFDGPADPLGPSAWEALLACWLAQLQPELPPTLQAPTYSLGLQLCDDATIAGLNSQWRQHDGPTDVLAFAALEDDGGEGLPPLPVSAGDAPLELGDIVISLETAGRLAADHGHELREELLFLASHGLLHLLGWDHPDEASLEVMLQRQQRLMAQTAAGNGGSVSAP